MSHVVLIACGNQKLDRAAKAIDLYQGALFKKSRAYAERLAPDAVYILSAKHGLVAADTVIAPYDETLNAKRSDEIRGWAARVLPDLAEVADLGRDQFTILAGDRYRRYLLPSLTHAEVPLKGLPIGKQLQRLDELCRR